MHWKQNYLGILVEMQIPQHFPRDSCSLDPVGSPGIFILTHAPRDLDPCIRAPCFEKHRIRVCLIWSLAWASGVRGYGHSGFCLALPTHLLVTPGYNNHHHIPGWEGDRKRIMCALRFVSFLNDVIVEEGGICVSFVILAYSWLQRNSHLLWSSGFQMWVCTESPGRLIRTKILRL